MKKKISQLIKNKQRKIQLLVKSHRLDEAEKACRALCVSKGSDASSWLLLGNIQALKGDKIAAIGSYKRALEILPDDIDTQTRIAPILMEVGNVEEAASYYSRIVEKVKDDPRILVNYSTILMALFRYSDAEPYLYRAIKLDPAMPQCYTNLGSCLSAQGKIEESANIYKQGLQMSAGDAAMHSNYLLQTNYLAEKDSEESLEEHKAWGAGYSWEAKDAAVVVDQTKNKVLKIGLVSPDFRQHSIAYFVRPLLEYADPSRIEIFCYSNLPSPDRVTIELKKLAGSWMDISRMQDKDVARAVRDHGIDILFDLAGHTSGNRLRLFTLKPAPVQAAWLGYPNTTGVSAIDYRFTDDYADPPGFDSHYVEKLVRMDNSFLCFSPYADSPPVGMPPCLKNGFITFGSFNKLAKVNESVIRSWVKILKLVPDSRLVIKNPGFSDKRTAERFKKLFDESGLDSDRVVLKGGNKSTVQHLNEYHAIDICLDTFPYNGTTTTCEALWMGVPVITVTGDVHASCVGRSLLKSVGLEDWIAGSVHEYIDLAKFRAESMACMSELRMSLRRRMMQSVLCDGRSFAASFEKACLQAWRDKFRNS